MINLQNIKQSNFIQGALNAHSKIDNLINGNDLKNTLKDMSGLQNMYKLGKEKQGFFTNNLIDALVDSKINEKNKFEDMLQFGIGTSFGKENKASINLTGGKGWANLGISKGF